MLPRYTINWEEARKCKDCARDLPCKIEKSYRPQKQSKTSKWNNINGDYDSKYFFNISCTRHVYHIVCQKHCSIIQNHFMNKTILNVFFIGLFFEVLYWLPKVVEHFIK